MIDPLTPGTVEKYFEEFVDQVKQTLANLYDLPYLQRHPLTRMIESKAQSTREPAGQQLRRELIKAIETLAPGKDTFFRSPQARIYNLMNLHYVEGLTIQECLTELGISERQAYRDLKHGQLTVAEVLWAEYASQPPEGDSIVSELSSVEVEVARLKPSLQSIEVNELIRWAVHAVQPLASKKDVELSILLAEMPVFISSDQAITQQILINLLSYSVSQVEQDKLYIELLTTLEGTNIILRWQSQHQPDDLKSKNPVVLELIEHLGCHFEQNVHKDRHQITLRLETIGPTVLIIDDNEGLVELLARYLTGHSCRVLTAGKGQMGFELAKSVMPDVILLDVMMPETDGWETLQRIRNYPSTINIPIIVCTVFNNPELAYSLGASLFLQKPVKQDDVLVGLRELKIIQ